MAGLEQVSELAPDFVKLAERANQLALLSTRFADTAAHGQVRWIEVSPHQARLVESPLDIRDALREQMSVAPKAWVFTSATLGDDDRLSWFTESAGLEDATILRLGSPFDYAHNARLYVPARFPKPNEATHRAGGGHAGGPMRTCVGRAHVCADHHAQGAAKHRGAVDRGVQGAG